MSATALFHDSKLPGGAYKETAVGLTANLDLYNGSGKLTALEIDNTVAAVTYFKFHDANTVDSTGIDAPMIAIAMPASTKRLILITTKTTPGGVPFTSRLAMRASDAAMVASGNDGSAPSSSCPVTVFMGA